MSSEWPNLTPHYSPCHTKSHFHHLARSYLIFQSTVRLQENPDIFHEKGLSWRPYSVLRSSDNDVATELAWHSITFQQSSYWHFSALSLCSQCVHCAFTVLTACWRRSDTSKNAVQSFNDNNTCVHPSSYSVVGGLTVQLWQPYGDPTALLLEIVWSSMRSHSIYWRCHRTAAEMLAIVLHAPRHSAFFLDAVR